MRFDPWRAAAVSPLAAILTLAIGIGADDRDLQRRQHHPAESASLSGCGSPVHRRREHRARSRRIPMDAAGSSTISSSPSGDRGRRRSTPPRRRSAWVSGWCEPADGTAGLWGTSVSGDLMELLGDRALIGRTLSPADDRQADVVVLSFDTWSRHFDRDPDILGRAIEFRAGGYLPVRAAPVDRRWRDAAVVRVRRARFPDADHPRQLAVYGWRARRSATAVRRDDDRAVSRPASRLRRPRRKPTISAARSALPGRPTRRRSRACASSWLA